MILQGKMNGRRRKRKRKPTSRYIDKSLAMIGLDTYEVKNLPHD